LDFGLNGSKVRGPKSLKGKEVQATVYNIAGEEVEKIELDDTIFGITPNTTVIHQAVIRQQANARQGTHDTKTRADVRGGGRKPWRQKGTGRARQGSTRSPQWRHGGVVFGPHPRSYVQDMPRKMRRLAIRSVLSAKAAEGRIVVVDSFEDLEPRTRAMIETMKKLNIGDSSALIMTNDYVANLELAAANLPSVKTMSAHLLSVVDMIKHSYIVMPRASLEIIDGILGSGGGRMKKPLEGFSGTASLEVITPKKKAEPKVEAKEEKEAKVTAAEAKAATAAKAEAETIEAETAEEEKPEKPKSRAKAAAKEPKATTGRKTGVAIATVHYSGTEYIEVMNNSDTAADLSGWTLRDKNDEGQAYTFEDGTELEPGKALKVYTEPGHKYTFDSKRPIWNDQGDEIELLDAKGKVVDGFAYGSYAPDEETGEEE
jgi:large subunit ribosomal protein L4